ncbi:MAG TPA: DUF6691 family protein [Vicinamibacterales bacterium]|nr:DUF6691 family protein [Vicinamibacterales bacterium]
MNARELLACYALGTVFGVVLVQGEIVSWFRIYEMFRFDAFYMYGVIGSALAVAAASLWLIRRSGARAMTGDPIAVPPKTVGRGVRYIAGGSIFGVGWGLTGACPGPLFAQIGAGATAMAVAAVAAIAGTWTYGALRPRLPH